MFEINATKNGETTPFLSLLTQTEFEAINAVDSMMEAYANVALVTYVKVEHTCYGEIFCGKPGDDARADCRMCQISAVLASI